MAQRILAICRESRAADPALDTALTAALLEAVASGAQPACLRLHRPGDVVAFSPLDAISAGFPAALEIARERGFGAVRRLAGGRAAVFTEETLAFAWCLPDPEPRRGIARRFERVASLVERALRGLGVDARVGPVPGEYCPGEYSVNAAGRRKLMGVGQRLVRGAAHVGGVIAVRRSDRLRAVLEPVYRALGLVFAPESAGSIEDEIGPVRCEEVAEALLAELSRHVALEPMGALPRPLYERAERLEPRHRA